MGSTPAARTNSQRMTPGTSKLGLIAVLLVLLLAGWVTVFRQLEPNPPFAASFLRYEGSNVVIQIENKSHSDLIYVTYFTSFAAGAQQVNGLVKSHESLEVTVRVFPSPIPPPASAVSLARINVACQRKPSGIRLKIAWLLTWIGIRSSAEQWETAIDLLPQNPIGPFATAHALPRRS